MKVSERHLEVSKCQSVKVSRSATTLKRGVILLISLLFLQTEVMAFGFDKYGGWEGIKGEKTGFFHTQKIDNRWWLVTPEGNAFFSLGMYCVRISGIPETETGKRAYRDNCLAKYGSESKWAEVSLNRLQEWGFNTIGDWSSYSIISSKQMPYVIGLEAGKAGKNVIPEGAYGFFPDVFDEEYKKAVEKKIEEKLNAYSGITEDPYLLGYFTSDEPSWYGSKGRRGALVDDFIALPDTAPGKKAWVEFSKNKRGKERQELKLEFLEKIAEKFSEVHADALRKYDKNHLILGSRPSRTYPEVLSGIGKYTDVFGLSFYELNKGDSIDAEFDKKIDELYKYGKKPIMLGVLITAKDSDLPFGMVKTQEDRGVSYWNYLKKTASNPNIVGLHWFQYFDPPRKCYDQRAANWGVVNDKDEPYEDAVELIAFANKRVYRYASGRKDFIAHPSTSSGQVAQREENEEKSIKIEQEKDSMQIKNPGFESKAGWKFQVWKGNGKVLPDSKTKHRGNSAVKITGGSGSGWESVGVAIQSAPGIELFKGVKYRLSGFIKTGDVENKAFIRIKFKQNDEETVYFETPGIYGSADWQEDSVSFIPKNSGEIEYLNVQLIGKGTAWFDDLNLEVIE